MTTMTMQEIRVCLYVLRAVRLSALLRLALMWISYGTLVVLQGALAGTWAVLGVDVLTWAVFYLAFAATITTGFAVASYLYSSPLHRLRASLLSTEDSDDE